MKKTIRKAGFSDLPVLVHIQHGYLEEDATVNNDHKGNNQPEILKVSISVSWECEEITSFDQLYNYAAVYNYLKELKDITLIGPLEEFIDEIDHQIKLSAEQQNINLTKRYVKVIRPDLIEGNVILEKETFYS